MLVSLICCMAEFGDKESAYWMIKIRTLKDLDWLHYELNLRRRNSEDIIRHSSGVSIVPTGGRNGKERGLWRLQEGETAWWRLLCVRGEGLCRVGWPAACDSGDPDCSCVQLTWVQPLEHSSECFFPRSDSVAVRCRTVGGGQVLGAPDPVVPGRPPKTGLRLPCGTEAGAHGRAVACGSGAPFWKPSPKPSLSSLTVISWALTSLRENPFLCNIARLPPAAWLLLRWKYFINIMGTNRWKEKCTEWALEWATDRRVRESVVSKRVTPALLVGARAVDCLGLLLPKQITRLFPQRFWFRRK